jgi:CBS domain-containing protein
VWVTRAVYWVEDTFDHLPVHWMWWPALGAIAVGVIGYFAPRTMGVGYDNIERILGGGLLGRALFVFIGLKFVSWAVSLGSGTSGGTLAPLFTVGGGLGALGGAAGALLAPSWNIDPRVGALVGMAAMFAGASRALLASVVFAFETTRQAAGLLPLLGGCTAAYLVSAMGMRTTIMTEKIARRGARVLGEYAVDYLDQILVKKSALRPVRTLAAEDSLATVRAFLDSRADGSSHQGFPVVDRRGELVGVVTRRDLLDPSRAAEARVIEVVRRAPAVIYDESSLREAADQMVRESVGRLPVVTRAEPRKVIGIVTRSDLLAAHRTRLDEQEREPGLVQRRKQA